MAPDPARQHRIDETVSTCAPVPDQDHLPEHVEILSSGQSVSFDDSWYDITDASHFWMQWRYRALSRVIASRGPRLSETLRVIDIGGGHGVLRTQIERASSWIVDLADVNAAALKASEPGDGRTLLYDVTEEKTEFVGQYDVVLLFDVIEHLEDPIPLMRSAIKHLKPGGWLLINVPACQALYSSYDDVIGHHRRYNRPLLLSELTRANNALKVVSATYWGSIMFPVLAARTLVLGRRPPDSPTERAKLVQQGIEAPSRMIHGILSAMMHVELSVPLRPPFGTSLMAIARSGID